MLDSLKPRFITGLQEAPPNNALQLTGRTRRLPRPQIRSPAAPQAAYGGRATGGHARQGAAGPGVVRARWPNVDHAKPAPRGHAAQTEGSSGKIVMQKLTERVANLGIETHFNARVDV